MEFSKRDSEFSSESKLSSSFASTLTSLSSSFGQELLLTIQEGLPVMTDGSGQCRNFQVTFTWSPDGCAEPSLLETTLQGLTSLGLSF